MAGTGYPGDAEGFDAMRATISDAVGAARKHSAGAGAATRTTIYGRRGIGVVFRAAREAVADTTMDTATPEVFDAALKAAGGAVDDSDIPINYGNMRETILEAGGALARMAARKGAHDAFAGMVSAGPSGAAPGRLLGSMRAAAARAARARLRQPDGAAARRAAAEGAASISTRAARITSQVVRMGASVHAATSAVFGAAIRDVPSWDLPYAIGDICQDLPGMAVRHGDLCVGFVTAVAGLIHDNTARRQKYQTATRAAEEASRTDAAYQISQMITQNTLEAIYMMLAAGAYATSESRSFEDRYEEALAAACGVDLERYRRSIPEGPFAVDIGGDVDIPEEVIRSLSERMAEAASWNLVSEAELARRKMFEDLGTIDYMAAAAEPETAGIISLYKMAYHAGYDGARAAGPGRQG